MLISFGTSLTSAYVWLQATERELQARLHYRLNGEWKTMVDAGYPFEFSLPLPDKEVAFEFRLEGMKPDGALQRSEAMD